MKVSFSNQWKHEDEKLKLKEKPICTQNNKQLHIPFEGKKTLDPGPFY